MDTRTREYVRGRFRDYYRRTDLSEPKHADGREWGFMGWGEDEDSLTRHLSVYELGNLDGYVTEECPKHVYTSTGRYDTPTATDVDEKGWRGSDLVFEVTVDSVYDENEADDDDDVPSFVERLEMCHDELITLIFRLDEFDFDDLDILFTGNGYRVQVYDDEYQQLGGAERAELLDYITAEGFTEESLMTLLEEEDPAESNDIAEHLAAYAGGWRREFYEEFSGFLTDLEEMDEEDAVDTLTEFNQIGEGRAEGIYQSVSSNMGLFESGQFDAASSNMQRVIRQFISDLVEEHRVALNGSVTTTPHNFVSLPGSLHGDTALRVLRVPREDLLNFDPFERAVPHVFLENEITIDVQTAGSYNVAGESVNLESGVQTVPEPLGLFLMARDKAEKTTE